MGDKFFSRACYRFLQRVSALEHTFWGKLGRTVEEGVKTLVGERDETRDSQWVNFHLCSGKMVRKRWGRKKNETRGEEQQSWNACDEMRLSGATKLWCELIICSLPGDDLPTLHYHVVMKLSGNSRPHCSPECKSVYQILLRSQHLFLSINRFCPAS